MNGYHEDDEDSSGEVTGKNPPRMAAISSKSPMIVVANRLPFVLARDSETGKLYRKPRYGHFADFLKCSLCHAFYSAGGLVTAVAPVVIETGGLWVGWPGIYLEDDMEAMPEADENDKTPTAGLKSEQIIPVNLAKEEFDDYYNGLCNACFWPLFHSMPDRAVFETDKWEAYRKVNYCFAELIVRGVQRLHQKDQTAVPLIWLHDYHLMLVSNYVRNLCSKEGLPIKVAFFLHIPFPSWDIFRLCPWSDLILQGILGCDSVGFHIEDYCLNFIDCCQRCLGCRVDRQQMLVENATRTVVISPLPISIPYERFRKLAESAETIVKNNENEQLVLGVDRLDYTKGIVQRIKAFETLLVKHPEHKEHVTLLQVAVPSRTHVKEYQELKERLDQLIGRINGHFSTPNWSPIRYIYGYVPQDQLAAFYRDSSVALVTPLRDGMNLVAKEFVACQTREPGVLVLSPFAGAGTTMHEALLANPYEINEFAEVIHRALTMAEDERELRMEHLRRRERDMDVNFWLQSFLRSVDCLENDASPLGTLGPITEDYFNFCLTSYVTETSRLALLLDYDGTLAPRAPRPSLAQMPAETKRILERLSKMHDVNIAIIAGRSLKDVQEIVGIPGITYAGNHGLEISHPDGNVYVHPVPQDFQTRKKILGEKLMKISKDGAWTEDKGSLLAFHYNEVSQDMQNSVMEDAHKIFMESGIQVQQAHMALETYPPVAWNKGRAAIYILRNLFGVDWTDNVAAIYVGDDSKDEEVMKALKGMAVTFRVTTSQSIRTAASYRIPNSDAVLSLLKWIDRRLSARLPHAPRLPSFSSLSDSGSPPLASSPRSPSSPHVSVPKVFPSTGVSQDETTAPLENLKKTLPNLDVYLDEEGIRTMI